MTLESKAVTEPFVAVEERTPLPEESYWRTYETIFGNQSSPAFEASLSDMNNIADRVVALLNDPEASSRYLMIADRLASMDSDNEALELEVECLALEFERRGSVAMDAVRDRRRKWLRLTTEFVDLWVWARTVAYIGYWPLEVAPRRAGQSERKWYAAAFSSLALYLGVLVGCAPESWQAAIGWFPLALGCTTAVVSLTSLCWLWCKRSPRAALKG